MPNFNERSTEPEWMDDDTVSDADFKACLADLARANFVTRARPPTIAWLYRATRYLNPGQSFSLVDVGFGYGDMLRAIGVWAANDGLVAELTGIDRNPRSAPIASAVPSPIARVTFRTSDVYATDFDPAPDFVISSLVAHHMTDAEIVRFLRWMDATAVRGWFVNDLHRHWLAYYGFKLLSTVAGWHRLVRHDGPVSVARSFRRADWMRLLAEAGVAGAVVRHRFPFRLCVGRMK